MAITYIANGGNVTGKQMLAAAVSGGISGAISAIAGPAAGSIAKSLGFATQGLLSSGINIGISAAGGAVSQGIANIIDPCNSSSIGKAALFGGIGSWVSTMMPAAKGMSTLSQAKYFGPKNLFKIFNSANKRLLVGSYAVSSVVGAAANF